MPAEPAYFDSTYLFKLYWNEEGSGEVRALAGACSRLICAAHGRAEVMAAAHRKFREGSADAGQLRALLDQFTADCDAGGIVFQPLVDGVFEKVDAVFRVAPAGVFLRAADALHLACAAENQAPKVYSNDRHMIAAAPLFGLEAVNVIRPALPPL